MWTEELSQKNQPWSEEQPYAVPVANRGIRIGVLVETPSLHSAPKKSQDVKFWGKAWHLVLNTLGPIFSPVGIFLFNQQDST